MAEAYICSRVNVESIGMTVHGRIPERVLSRWWLHKGVAEPV